MRKIIGTLNVIALLSLLLVVCNGCGNKKAEPTMGDNTSIQRMNETIQRMNETSQEKISQAKQALKIDASIAAKQLKGKKVDAMTRVISCDFDGSDVIYTYEIDEDVASIDDLRTMKETLKGNVKSVLDNTPGFAATKKNLQIIDGKVVYNYVGNKSKKVLTITIEP